MKRLLALAAALVLLVALPMSASAARAARFTDHFMGISCDGPESTSGGGFVFFGANASDEFGPDAFVDYWTTDEPEGNPDLVRDFDQPVDVTWDGSVLAGSIPMIDLSSGDPAGPATFSATLVPTGDPEPFEDEFRDGNRQGRFTGVFQPMDPSGSLTVGDSTFTLDGCFAEETTVTVFETNPRSFVTHFTDRSVNCDLANADGDTAFFSAFLEDDLVFIDAGAFPEDGSDGIGAIGEAPLIDGVVDASLETYDFDTGEPNDAGGSVHVEIVGGEPFEYVIKYATGRELVRGEALDLEGTLTIGSMTFDLGPCIAVDALHKIFDNFPNGPKPGGKVPANDLPSGAKLLTVGSRTTVATKGASPEREAPYECLSFEEDGEIIEIPVGHTVWYRIVGTGGTVTIDTAGSDYDTVAAVYTSDGAGGFDPVPGACVDDVPLEPLGRTLQTAVTWQTVAGTVYYVQIGGYPQSLPYGNLRVAVY